MYARNFLPCTSGYKPFIDGLRAISILAVVGYHLGLKSLPGGFVGVDIFFVISGFLIVTHLARSIANDSFSFGEFWAKRALRILPPYLLVVIVSFFGAWYLLVLPDEIKAFGDQAAYSVVMLANHYFLDQQGYFDGSADTKPLLHLWSLGVEEQFYLITPILFFLLHAATKRLSAVARYPVIAVVVCIVFAVSLYWCIQLSVVGVAAKNYAFFLMPLRAWEFIAGGVIAFLIPIAKKLPKIALEALSVAGLWAIIEAVISFSGSDQYPGYLAVLPVFGAVAVLVGGLARPQSIVPRILALKPFVWIGLISYGWYLWHWPLLTFGRIYNFGERHLIFDSAIVILSVLLATASYFAVDRKVLNWRNRQSFGVGWRHIGFVSLLCVPVLLVNVLFSQVFSPLVLAGLTEEQFPQKATTISHCNLHTIDDAAACVALADGRDIGLIIGDSHGDAASRRLGQHAQKNGTMLATMASGACAPLLGARINILDSAMRERCWGGRDNALELIGRSIHPKFAVLLARWEIYVGQKGGEYSLLGPTGQPSSLDTRDQFIEGLRSTVSELKRKGVERILVVGPLPGFATSLPACIMRADRYGVDFDRRCSVSRSSIDEGRKSVTSWIEQGVKNEASVRYYDPIDQFCDQNTCRGYGDEGVLFYDTNHVGDAGVDRIFNGGNEDFLWLFGQRK